MHDVLNDVTYKQTAKTSSTVGQTPLMLSYFDGKLALRLLRH